MAHAPALSVEFVADTLVVSYRGVLDGPGAIVLRETVEAAFAADVPQRVEIDLRAVVETTSEGIVELAACSRLGARVVGGLQYRVGA